MFQKVTKQSLIARSSTESLFSLLFFIRSVLLFLVHFMTSLVLLLNWILHILKSPHFLPQKWSKVDTVEIKDV